MAEPNIGYSLDDLRSEVAEFIGYSPTSTDWTAEQEAELDKIINKGYRWFLNPPLLQGQAAPHRWRFLRPTRALTVEAGTDEYDLWDDYAGFQGPLSYRPSQTTVREIIVTSEGDIRRLRSLNSDTTGAPVRAAVRPYEAGKGTSERYRLMLWPTPDSAYTIEGKVILSVNKLSDDNPTPLGSVAHGDAILEACLGQAELWKDDEKGPHYEEFVAVKLPGAIARDLQSHAAESLGYMSDPSTSPTMAVSTHSVTYNGVQY